MKTALPCPWAARALIVFALLGCGPSGDGTTAKTHQSIALSDQEDAVCGMLVREMSAPRGQVVHRDGSRFFFCSLGDMLIHLDAPSPHGRVEAIFVEVMTPDENPMQSHTGDHPWVPASEAVFVVGIDRPGIMGAPVLAYANQSDADHVSQGRSKTQRLDMAGLREWWMALGR
jgi:nitrous oxide reductase accessory protein NosL